MSYDEIELLDIADSFPAALDGLLLTTAESTVIHPVSATNRTQSSWVPVKVLS